MDKFKEVLKKILIGAGIAIVVFYLFLFLTRR
jgi:multidrug efflux pump subunit AcrB